MFGVKALGILDAGDGTRILGQFYRPALKDGILHSAAKQKSLEKNIASASKSAAPGATDVLIDSSNTVLFQRLPASSSEGLVVYVCFSCLETENELLYAALLDALIDGLKVIFSPDPALAFSSSRQTVLDNYDAVSILFDELVDDGVILELDPAPLSARLPRRAPQGSKALQDIRQYPFSRSPRFYTSSTS